VHKDFKKIETFMHPINPNGSVKRSIVTLRTIILDDKCITSFLLCFIDVNLMILIIRERNQHGIG